MAEVIWNRLRFLPLMVASLASAQEPAESLQPLPHPELPPFELPDPGTPLWVYVVSALLIALLLGLVGWLLLRPSKPKPPALKKPWQTAQRALRDLESQAASLPPSEVASQVSEILRRYFLDRYQIPAPFRTTPEIFEKDAIPSTSPRLNRYAGLAQLWDQLAFAPLPKTPAEATALIKQALAHLEEDRP